ncbi:hypothetical protein A250_24994, partial [Pseudomonas syringae pv. actinidiae ICMP 9617]
MCVWMVAKVSSMFQEMPGSSGFGHFLVGWFLLRGICTGAMGFLADIAVSKMAVGHGQLVYC